MSWTSFYLMNLVRNYAKIMDEIQRPCQECNEFEHTVLIYLICLCDQNMTQVLKERN
jgi:hypothetical protein